MTQDQFIAQAVIAGKTRAQALALYAEAFPPPPEPAPTDVVAYRRDVFPDGRIQEREILGNGSARVVKDQAP